MRILLKIVAGIAGLLIVLLAALALIVATIDTRTLLAPIETQLERATGRDVTLGGEAKIGLSLSPTLSLADVTLGNAPWGSAKEMIRAKRIEAQVALLPLMSRRIDIVRITLVEPTILLETDRAGRGNWVFAEPGTAPATASDPVTDATGAFGLGEFAVEKGDVRWRDGRTGEVTPIRIDKLYLRARDPNKPVVAEFAGTVGDIPLALEGHFGPLAALRARQWPWPVSVKGEIANRKTEVETKVRDTPDGIEADDLMLAIGDAKARGRLVYARRGSRPFVAFTLHSDALTLADLAVGGGATAVAAGGKGVPAPKSVPSEGRIFLSTPVPLAGLHALDAKGDLAIGKLTLRDGRTIANARAKLDLAGGRLEVSEFGGDLLGGTARGRLTVDARNAQNPQLSLRLDGRGFDLAALMAAAGIVRDMKGGKADIDLDVNARGDSPREWASSVSGLVVAKLGGARWVSSGAGMSTQLEQLANAFNPLRTTGKVTELRCAAARLPFAGGVARTDRGIGLETDQLGVAASGTIDLRNETLNLLVHPRIKDRSGVDLARIAGAVRIQGRLDAPAVAFNPVGSIEAAGDIAALVKGGRAALLGALAPTAPSGPGECAVALGATRAEPSPSRAAPSRPSSPDVAQDVGRAIGKLLGR